MKNQQNWKPTKYVFIEGKLRSSRDRSEVSVGSRLMADLIAREYQNRLPELASGHLLDLGCGQAPLFGTYQQLVDSVTCVDWDHSPHKTDHIDIKCDLSKPLPLENQRYDTVILSDVLEHIAEPNQLIGEINRILAPNGVLLLNVPFYYCIHEAPHDYFRYTEFALHKFLTENRFEAIEISPVGGSVEVIADILGKHVQFIPMVGPPLAATIHLIASLFSKSRIGRKIAKATGQHFPFGYFVVAKKPGGISI